MGPRHRSYLKNFSVPGLLHAYVGPPSGGLTPPDPSTLMSRREGPLDVPGGPVRSLLSSSGSRMRLRPRESSLTPSSFLIWEGSKPPGEERGSGVGPKGEEFRTSNVPSATLHSDSSPRRESRTYLTALPSSVLFDSSPVNDPTLGPESPRDTHSVPRPFLRGRSL